MNPFLARTLFIPAIYKYWKTPVFDYYNKYMSNEQVSIEELKQYQKDKLAEILNYAANKTEYYKDVLSKNNLKIGDYSADALLSKLPILTKQIIQDEGSRLYSDDYISTGFTTEHSGGSTGQPTAVRKDLKTRAAVHAATWRANCWTGWKLGESWTWLWGRLETTQSSFSAKCISQYKSMFMNEGFFNIHGLNPNRLRQFLDNYNKTRPSVLIGYTNALYHLSLLAKEEKIKISPPKGIATTAETLFENQRDIIESVFQCKIFNRYGSSEVGLIASECDRHNGFHIAMENLFVECIRENGEPCRDGEPGRLLITDLNNRAMPLIRYDLGDVGLLTDERCNCGRPYQRIKKISGRLSDILRLPDGRIVFPDDLAEIFYPISQLKKFQVIQETPNDIIVKIVITQIDESLIDIIRSQIKTVLGDEITTKVLIVKDIPLLASGKHRICISKLKL